MKWSLGVTALCFSGLLSAETLNGVVIFGDSLSDNGNLYEVMHHQFPQSPPYYQGRFSNGPVWVERLVQGYYGQNADAHLEDYAYGGAGILEDDEDPGAMYTLKREVGMYLDAHDRVADASRLYIVWIGGNNYFAAPDAGDEAVDRVIRGTVNELRSLVNAGARHILVANLPNMGDAPIAREFDAKATLDALSRAHNDALKAAVEGLRAEYPDVQWLFYDTEGMQSTILKNPQEFGFTNTQDTCVDLISEENMRPGVLPMVSRARMSRLMKRSMDACDGYMFFDAVHVTGPLHQIMADEVRVLLENAGLGFA